MPVNKHKGTIAAHQALIGHLIRTGGQVSHIDALRGMITDIRKCGSVPVDIQGKPLRPMQHVCMKGKSYTILSAHFLCCNEWAIRLRAHGEKQGVLVRTSVEVIGW